MMCAVVIRPSRGVADFEYVLIEVPLAVKYCIMGSPRRGLSLSLL